MNDQIKHDEEMLKFGTDPSDLHAALAQGEKIVVVDARDGYETAK